MRDYRGVSHSDLAVWAFRVFARSAVLALATGKCICALCQKDIYQIWSPDVQRVLSGWTLAVDELLVVHWHHLDGFGRAALALILCGEQPA